MAAGYIMRRDGSFVVELNTPLQHGGRKIDELVIASPRFEHTIRWGRREIGSALALLSELTDLPERLLRQICYPDVDRVTFALFSQANFAQKEVMEGQRPFASPEEDLPEPTAVVGGISDQQDPRFPHVAGPIQRFPAPPGGPLQPNAPQPIQPQAPQPIQPQAPQGDTNLDFGPPEVGKAVNG